MHHKIDVVALKFRNIPEAQTALQGNKRNEPRPGDYLSPTALYA
jgi:hypothetical protein